MHSEDNGRDSLGWREPSRSVAAATHKRRELAQRGREHGQLHTSHVYRCRTLTNEHGGGVRDPRTANVENKRSDQVPSAIAGGATKGQQGHH